MTWDLTYIHQLLHQPILLYPHTSILTKITNHANPPLFFVHIPSSPSRLTTTSGSTCIALASSLITDTTMPASTQDRAGSWTTRLRLRHTSSLTYRALIACRMARRPLHVLLAFFSSSFSSLSHFLALRFSQEMIPPRKGTVQVGEREKHLETRFGLFGNAYPTELKSGFSYAREISLLAFFFFSLRDVEKVGGGDADTDRRGKRKTASFFGASIPRDYARLCWRILKCTY